MDIEEGMHVGVILYTSLGFVKSAGRWSSPLVCWILLISVVSYHSAKWFVFGSVDCNKYQIQIPLPPKIDSRVTMMTVEEKPDVTYSDIWGGGFKQQVEKMRGVGLTWHMWPFLDARNPIPFLLADYLSSFISSLVWYDTSASQTCMSGLLNICTGGHVAQLIGNRGGSSLWMVIWS
jgi:hypothetical protein